MIRFACVHCLIRLKNFLHKLIPWILKALAPLGLFGVFAIAAIDAGSIPLPLDALVATYVYNSPAWFIVPILAALGSALGGLVIYGIGLKGEEMLLAKRIPKQKLERIRDRFERQEFFAVMIPAILPPPTPIKLFLLAAGAFRMRVREFFVAMLAGRLVRFYILAGVVHYFGPEIVHVIRESFREHFAVTVLAILAIAAAIGFLLWRKPAKEIQKAADESQQRR